MKNVMSYESLVAGIRDKNVGIERARLVEKWSRSGLLRNLDGVKRENMAQLLENQMGHILKESNALSTGGGQLTSSGQIQGYTNIALPMVRKVFGGLVANELVSVQAMSLPSGLVFYLDYTYGSNVGGNAGVGLSNSATLSTYTRGQSIYNNPTAKGVRSGSLAAGGMYDLVGGGYSKVHSGSTAVSGSNQNIGAWTGASEAWSPSGTVAAVTSFTGTNALNAQFDPKVESDLSAGSLDFTFAHFEVTALSSAIAGGDPLLVDQIGLFACATANNVTQWGASYQQGNSLNLRRLNRRGDWDGSTFTPNPINGTHIQMVLRVTNGGTAPLIGGASNTVSMAISDSLTVDSTSGATLTLPSYETDFGSTPSPSIAEIDIKIEAISIVTTSRKLKARWSPELAQDLNAYMSLDAEVEITGVLSEQMALEVDREILVELLQQANGANLFWSRMPGKFLNKTTAAVQLLASSLSPGPAFTGNVQDWYQTLVETINDVANTIHRKTLRGSANFLVTSPDVCTILESTLTFKPKISIDGEGQVSSPFTMGAEAIGTVQNRYTLYKDPYFPQNKILLGYKGKSYLENGYVYAPYVPVIMTQTIYQPDDFTPRKAIMTRYGKKMIRSDFFGTVTVLDMGVI